MLAPYPCALGIGGEFLAADGALIKNFMYILRAHSRIYYNLLFLLIGIVVIDKSLLYSALDFSR